MWPHERGVDIACTWGNKWHTIRFRYVLDANLRVKLLACGVMDGKVVCAEVVGRQVKTTHPTSRQHTRVVRSCMASARPVLNDALQRFLQSFPPRQRQLLRG